jgi:hypothetical protein
MPNDNPSVSQPLSKHNPVVGPLQVSTANRRYFTLASGDAADQQAVYLTGSHIYDALQDGMGPGADCAAAPRIPAPASFTQDSAYYHRRISRLKVVSTYL